MKKYYLIIIYLILPIFIVAQERIVNGVVTDASEELLIGVNITIKGTNIGTVTNTFGEYSITATKNDILVFSYIGYETVELIADVQDLNIVLREDVENLKEVEVRGFSTIVGRARKRRENMQETPESMTALSARDLEVTGAKNMKEITRRIPNVSFNDYQDAANFTINIRGITQVRDGVAPVSIVIDDVQMPFHFQLNQDMYDIEQVEVVKGPQGTLYGQNAIAGAINIITKQPSNQLKGKAKVSYATGGDKRTSLNLGGAIVKDKVYFRLGGTYRDFDGYEENRNTFLNELTDFNQDYSIRGQLRFNVTKNFNIDLKGQFNNSDGGALYYIIAPPGFDPPPPTSSANQFEGNPNANILGTSQLMSKDASLKLNYTTSFGRFLSVTNFSGVDYDSAGDLDHTEDATSEFAMWQKESTKLNGYNQEVRFLSSDWERTNFITGLFYQDNSKEQILDSGLDEGLGLDSPSFGELTNNIDSRTFAAFGSLSYKLVDALEATVGLRYDIDKRVQNNGTGTPDKERDFEQLQPKFGLSYKIKKGTIIYANYGLGYRSGGFNPDGTVESSRFHDEFEKEVSKNVEVGFKSSWWNNRFIFNTSMFHMVFENEQVYVIDLTNFYALGVFNLEEGVNYGLEIEIKLRAAKGLDFGFGLGLMDSEIKKASIAQNFPSTKDDPFGSGGNWEGNKAPFVNSHNLLFSAHYTFNINNDNKISLYADVENNGRFYWHPDNFDVQNPYTLVNFNVHYTYKGLNLGVFGKNIMNTEYNAEYFSNTFSGAYKDLRFPATPAIFGVELAYKF